jgi:hypothetical protein
MDTVKYQIGITVGEHELFITIPYETPALKYFESLIPEEDVVLNQPFTRMKPREGLVVSEVSFRVVGTPPRR